ncbi:MAG TPA: phage portal protein [Candidatus Kapabacteria bacterium]|nr:phage portal protein [Candidatus Kapabacteria bacterium]
MNIALGKLNISISKNSPQDKIPLAIASGGIPGSFLFNRFDHPRQNLLLIRETVSAAMHARSEAIGRGELHGYEIRGTEKKLLSGDHEIEKILAAPNPMMTGSDLLELTSQWLDATGNALFLKVRNGYGRPSELWLLPATSYTIERGTDELPMYYRFFPTNTQVAAADVIHIKRSDIRTAPYYGHAILSDIIETAKTDSALRLYQQRFFDNDSMPRAVLRFPKGTTLSQSQIDDLKNAWEEKYQGAINAGKLAILPDGGDLEPLGTSSKELDFTASRNALRDAIREAFKVPKIALGDTDGVNLANADTSYRIFMRDIVDHALGKIADALTRGLAAEFSERIVIRHEAIIPEAEDQFIGRLQELKQALTIDEQRKLLGLAPLASGKGNVFVIGKTVYDGNWKTV